MSLEAVATMMAEMQARLVECERKLANVMRPARVIEVDVAKGLVKVRAGELDSTWLPWTERAGAIKSWSPPAIDEQVHLFSPGGEPAQGWVMQGGFSNANPQPHDKGGEHKLVAAKILLDGDVTITGAVRIIGDTVRHNGKNIGDTHKHGGVTPGGGITGVPAN